MTITPRISLIVPARNEADLLPRLLASVALARARLPDPSALEVIVADNASTDATATIAAQQGCRVVKVEKRIIGAVRNGGAAAAGGEILAFVDADSVVHPDVFQAILLAMDDQRCGGGASGLVFDRRSAGILVTYYLVKPVVRLLGVEGGVVFCRAADFHHVGGYPEDQLVSEDIKLLMALKRHWRGQGQVFRVLRNVPTQSSSRKFDQHGDWHMLKIMFLGPLQMLFSRRRFDSFARRYWYDGR